MAHPRERGPRGPFGQPLSRRQFLRRSAGAAIAYPTLSALLAACGRASNPNAPPVSPSGSSSALPLARPNNPVTWPIYDDNPPIDAGLQPEADATLKIYNWEDYLWPK